MKKNYLFLLPSVLLVGCASDTDVLQIEAQNDSLPWLNKETRINLDEAMDIANTFMCETRSDVGYNIDYVTLMNEQNKCDTLAYVLNREGDKGFVVVGVDNRTTKILAYSEEGKFAYEPSIEDPVYSEFVTKLPSFYERTVEYPEIYSQDETISPYNIGYSKYITPKLQCGSWYQSSPYNKYVSLYEGANYMVGCVAIATGQIMLHCKDVVSMNVPTNIQPNASIAFILHQMRNTLKQGPQNVQYDGAMNHLALMLYFIGKGVDMSYGLDSSGASSGRAIQLLKDLGYYIPTGGLVDFNELDMIRYLNASYILYARGSNGTGHAWVIDGGHYSYYNDAPDDWFYIYLHCDWGWGGTSNGFYTATINESIYNYNVSTIQYAPVKQNISL